MAIRTIIKEGDPILTKVCRPVEKFDEKLAILLDDMAETMYFENRGIGIAAVQVTCCCISRFSDYISDLFKTTYIKVIQLTFF